MNTMDLTEMEPGQKGRVVEVRGGKGMITRLDGMGIRCGVELVKVSAQIMRGPVIVEVGRTRVAIGYGMARRVIVTNSAKGA